MKFLYIVLNILFITVIVIASRSYFVPADDNLLNKTKKVKATTATPVKTKQQTKPQTAKPLNANIAVKYNLFNPNRGGSANNDAGIKKASNRNSYAGQQFKLVGVYRFGKKHGAIIISSNRSSRSRSGRRARKITTAPKKAKRFYRLGDMLDNGFILKKVDTRTVLLSKGSESITLEMERNNPTVREGSKPKRNAKRVSMNERRSKGRYPTRGMQPLPTIIN
ncbi:MAG: hypothetical protein L3J71_05955 [Victivallaceae bacterium]|nr:hypothetical protein [Victivallaceae bacterium]